jgi:hypothetical protein
MQIILKIAAIVIILCGIIISIKPESPINTGTLFIIIPMIILFISSGITIKSLVSKNIIITISSLSFSVFIAISALIEGGSPEAGIIAAFIIKTVLIFNLILMGAAWLGTPGFLWFLGLIPSRGVQVYFLLFYRGISGFKRISSLVVHQIRSRVNIRSGEKYLVPRYYIYNMMMKEINMLTYYQAALASRNNPIPVTTSLPSGGFAMAALIILISIPSFFR